MRVVKSHKLMLYDLTEEQKREIKNALTFDNPKYKLAKNFSRNGYTSIPPYLRYYNEATWVNELDKKKKCLEVPIGFNLEKYPIESVTDCRIKKEIEYPIFNLELREDQQKAKEGYLNEVYNSETPKNIIQLATGKGKTIVALNIAYTLKQKTLILVHKDDLVVGWTKDIKKCFGEDIEVGLLKAQKRKVGDYFTIATVQTLSRMSEEELNKYTNQFGLVIQDECLVGDTLVVFEDGSVKPMRNVNNDNIVLGGKVSNKFNRQSSIWELESSHSILKGSPTHPTWCVKKTYNGHTQYTENDFEVKPIKDITKDYMIPIKIKIPHTTLNNTSENLARFIALIQCDGHLDTTSKRVKVNVQKDRKYYYEVLKKGCEEFKAELKFSNDTRENITYWTIDSKIRNYLSSIIPSGKKSNIIEVPLFMYSAPIETIKAYIETCFNCEGDLSLGYSNRLNFSTCSENFAQGLSLLLKKFGILCNIQHIRRNEKCSDVYRLSLCGIFFNLFMDTFNLINRKMTKKRNVANKNKNRFVGDYYLSDVKCSSSCGYEATVFDFTVAETHSFIANGVYTHNCHHIGLNIFNVIDKFKSFYKLGLSATPQRSDGLDFVFELFFGGIAYKYEYTVNDKDILRAKVIIQNSNFKYKPFLYKGVVYNYYDFEEKDLPKNISFISDLPYEERPIIPYLTIDNSVVSSKPHKIQICRDIISEYRQGHSCIALFTQKEHIDLYYKYLCRYIPKEKIMLYYGDNKEKSDVLMERAESREVLITLATYAKATEGTNVKAWEVEFLVSSINSKKNVEQAVGRIRRSNKGKLDPVRIYDYRVTGYSISKHINTRIGVYKELKFIIEDLTATKEPQGLFSRGYK